MKNQGTRLKVARTMASMTQREWAKAMLKWIKRELELKQEAEQEAVNQSLEKIDRLK